MYFLYMLIKLVTDLKQKDRKRRDSTLQYRKQMNRIPTTMVKQNSICMRAFITQDAACNHILLNS